MSRVIGVLIRGVPLYSVSDHKDGCVSSHWYSHFMTEVGGQVVPPYMIATKEAVKERAEPVWTRRKNLPNVTESYHNYMTNVSPLCHQLPSTDTPLICMS